MRATRRAVWTLLLVVGMLGLSAGQAAAAPAAPARSRLSLSAAKTIAIGDAAMVAARVARPAAGERVRFNHGRRVLAIRPAAATVNWRISRLPLGTNTIEATLLSRTGTAITRARTTIKVVRIPVTLSYVATPAQPKPGQAFRLDVTAAAKEPFANRTPVGELELHRGRILIARAGLTEGKATIEVPGSRNRTSATFHGNSNITMGFIGQNGFDRTIINIILLGPDDNDEIKSLVTRTTVGALSQCFIAPASASGRLRAQGYGKYHDVLRVSATVETREGRRPVGFVDFTITPAFGPAGSVVPAIAIPFSRRVAVVNGVAAFETILSPGLYFILAEYVSSSLLFKNSQGSTTHYHNPCD